MSEFSGRRICILAAAMSIIGCGGGSIPTAPTLPPAPAISIAGSWSGSVTDPFFGNGTVQLTLGAVTPNALTGNWSMAFPNGQTFSGFAMATEGAPASYGVGFHVEPKPACSTTSGPSTPQVLSYGLTAVSVTATKLMAVSSRISCTGIGGFGNMELSRQ